VQRIDRAQDQRLAGAPDRIVRTAFQRRRDLRVAQPAALLVEPDVHAPFVLRTGARAGAHDGDLTLALRQPAAEEQGAAHRLETHQQLGRMRQCLHQMTGRGPVEPHRPHHLLDLGLVRRVARREAVHAVVSRLCENVFNYTCN